MNNKKIPRGAKYAFNINDINSPKQFKGSLLDFKSLNRGTYDEIESNDIIIKDKIEKLKLLKNDTIKEFVYTNKDIPVQWKNKLDYKKSLLKIFIKDNNFLSYLGIGNQKEIPKSTKNKEKKENEMNIKSNEPEKINIEITESNISKENDQEKTTNTPNRTGNKFFRNKEKHNYTDKEIIGILEDFKSAYPILIKEKESSEMHIKNNMKNPEEKINRTYNDFTKRKYSNNINNNFSLPNLKLKSNKRQKTFRQNIFTNLLPSKPSINITPKFQGNYTSRNFYQKRLNQELKNKNDLYLNSNSELFDKKIKVNNPTIMKHLEGINFYGPYFSYCPPCGNKNLEFYKNLEQNQCLQIIQQIKKNKGRHIILSDDKNHQKSKG